MLTSRAKHDAKREQLIEHLTRQVHPETWDLIRHGRLTHLLYKVGDEPGFFAMLNAGSLAEATAMVTHASDRLGPFEVDIEPVKQFPHFD
jgi:hypothetical protein